MLRVTGDFAKLKAFAKKLDELGGSSAVRKLATVLAEEARELADEGFSSQRDPYGRAWAPIKHRAGQILRDTGRLQRSLTYKVHSSGFTLRYSAVYGVYHQAGTRRMVARKIVPDKTLPPGWVRSFVEATEEFFRDHFG